MTFLIRPHEEWRVQKKKKKIKYLEIRFYKPDCHAIEYILTNYLRLLTTSFLQSSQSHRMYRF